MLGIRSLRLGRGVAQGAKRPQLQQRERVDVRAAHLHGPLQHGLVAQQIAFRDALHPGAGEEHLVHHQFGEVLPVAEREIAARDALVGLGQAHRDVVDHGAEERPLLVRLAKALFVCAGGIETPRLLLHTGLANGSGQVGRNFMAHGATQVWGRFDTEDFAAFQRVYAQSLLQVAA